MVVEGRVADLEKKGAGEAESEIYQGVISSWVRRKPKNSEQGIKELSLGPSSEKSKRNCLYPKLLS